MNSLLALFGAFLLLAVLTALLQRGWLVLRLRPLRAGAALQELRSQAIEEGRRVHLGLGSGRLGEPTTVETLAGLAILDWLAADTAVSGQAPIATSADPASALLAQDRGERGDVDARFIAPDPVAYGLGARGAVAREERHANVLLGHFGDEYLFLAGEQPAGASPVAHPTAAGSTRLETLPQIALTTDGSLVGEELFAAGAYTAGWPSHLASLLLQDLARIAIAVVILVGALLGWRGG